MEKYRALFVEESQEHLAELSRLLVELETAQEPASLIEDIFRRVHSIKGMAASMSFEATAELAHTMEDVTAKRRDEGAGFDAGTIDLLLRGVDALGQQVEAVANDRAPEASTDLVEALGALLAGDVEAGEAGDAEEPVPANASRSKPARAPEGEASDPSLVAGSDESADDEQSRARDVHVVLDSACKAPAVRMFMVHRKLSELGTVRSSTPTVQQMKSGEVHKSRLHVVFEGALADQEIEQALLAVSEVAKVTLEAAREAQAPPPIEPSSDGANKPAVSEAQPDSLRAAASVRVRTDVLDTLIDNVGEMFILRERLENLLADVPRPELRSILDALSGAIRDMHGQVMTVRMTPMRTLTDRYPRLVRDLARSLDKEVELEIDGSEIELDRAILDNLDSPFVHTLRNAIDHGIEEPETRLERGKPQVGKVRITATRDRDTVVVIIEDDGGGLDADVLRARAVRSGLLTETQAEGLPTREALFLICTPGFSTKSQVSAVSGRGVGMDAVRAKIESLGGTLDIESEVGRGSRFIFRLPLTVAIINALLVQAGERRFAIPVAKIVAVRELGDDLIQEASGATYLGFRHALAPVFNLSELLEVGDICQPMHAVVLEDNRDLVAVSVDRVVGYHEVVVKPLGDPLDRMEWFSGATILGDGEPVLILDLPKALRPRRAA